MKNERDDDAFVERIAHVLRAPEQVRPDFDLRVMSGLQAVLTTTPARRSGSWWRRPRVYRVTPIGQLAMAAGVATLVIGGAWLAARVPVPDHVPPVAEARTADTVHVVRFVFVDSSATNVALVGSFNQWRRDATVFQPTGVPGVWAVEVALPAGRHEYAFVVSDSGTQRWVADPFAPRHRDDFGTESSVLAIRRGASSS